MATLLDIAKLNGSAKEVGLIESVATAAPELMTFPARTIRGTSYKTVDRHALPTTGFRQANGGIAASKSKFKSRLVECFIFSGSVQSDQAVADAYEDGAAAYNAMEAEGVMRSAAIEIGKQVYYGTDEDANGFPGIVEVWDSAKDITGISVDATGTTADTASSVYAVKFGPQFAQMIYGSGRGLRLAPFREQTLSDGEGGNYPAYVSDLSAWVGLQIANPYSIGRLYNLTEDSDKGLTDSLLADLLGTFPVGMEPDALFMSRRSRTQLQKSRSVVLQGGGAGSPNGGQGAIAPVPTEYDGIPIIATDSIVNTEAIVA